MAGYIALSWSAGDRPARSRALDLLDRLERTGGWRRSIDETGFCLSLSAVRPPQVRPLLNDRGVIIGDLFDRRTGRLAASEHFGLAPDPGSAGALCRRLTAEFWGRYVVISRQSAAQAPTIFRDPSGALDCLVWRTDGLTIVTSDLADLPTECLPPRLAINWERIGGFLIDPANMGAALGLDGVRAVTPGAMLAPEDPQSVTMWNPAAFANSPRAPIEAAEADLVRVVDACLGAYAGAGGPILAEVSGGLDSAIVASALGRSSGANVVQWLNYHIADPQGDERGYARAVADHLGLQLTEAKKPELDLTIERLAALGSSARPSLNTLDAHYDEDLAKRCAALGAHTILTGQGGDAVFFQMRTPLIAADALHHRLTPRQTAALFAGLASWTRSSIWSVARAACLQRLGVGRDTAWRPPPFLSRALRQGDLGRDPHPWLRDLEGVAPAKRLQIHSLASALLFHGGCQRARRAELVHPLLFQPVVELCLSIPSFDLTLGRRDRALARRAFAGRLPAGVIERRSKGDLTAYYGRMLGRSLGVLCPFLLEGRLADHGLIDRDLLSALLTEEALICQGGYPDLLELIAIEAWVQHWESRIRNCAANA